MDFARQSFFILLAIGTTIFLKSIFANSLASILGILVIFYLAFFNRKKIKNLNFYILISLVVILISSTGAISSPFFFLLYLLSFGIAFALDPKTVFVFTVGVIILLFPEAFKTDLTRNLIALFSLFLLSPVAFFSGFAYWKNQENRKRIEDMKKKAQEIENDIEEVLFGNEALQKAEEVNQETK